MAKRGRKVDPESENQLIKEVFFGKADMHKYPNVWRQWPAPYKQIYSRMFSKDLKLVPAKEAKQLSNLALALNDIYAAAECSDILLHSN